MRPKISVYIALSIDGYIARPDGNVDWLESVGDPEEDYGYKNFLQSVDTVILGRKTYDTASTVSNPYPGKRVVVLSHSLKVEHEDIEVYGGDPSSLLTKLHGEGVRHIWVDGGITISRFLSSTLVDSMILSIIPIVLGEGLPLFHPLSNEIPCRLISSQSFKSGLVQLKYAIDAASP